jgi:hypothetical protein
MMQSMRPLRVLVTLLLLVIQFRPVAAALSCIYEERVAAAACGSGMDDMSAMGHDGKVAKQPATPSTGPAIGTAATRTDCGFASICAAPAPALVRPTVSLVAPFAFTDAASPRLSLLSPGERAAPPTQPPRA